MRKMVLIVLMFLAVPVSSFAQHRYLGEGGAKILQCARFYSSLEAQLLCARGDELSAGQIERLGLVDRNERIGQYGGNYGYNGGDGYFYPTDSYGRPTGTRERIVTGGAIGALLGAGVGAIFNRGGTGALLGAGAGAVVGVISGSKAGKRAKQEAQVRETQYRAETQARAEVQQQVAEESQQIPLVIRNTTGFTARLYQDDRRVRDLRPGQSFSGPEAEYRAELRVPARGGYVELVEAELRPHERGWDIVPPKF
ncbi:MAG: hypothetical protein Q8R34_02535 [bacterium]|nr:hypothetical protein [bacterium]